MKRITAIAVTVAAIIGCSYVGGAGADTDGQVLVVQDMLGLTFGRVAKFVRNFMKEQAGETAILDAFKAYHAAVQDGSFPAREQTFQVEL